MKSIFKKIISAALAVAAISSVAVTASARDINKYDLNGDGIFDVQDVTYLQEGIANGDTLDSKADFDKSGTINVNDVTYLQMHIAGKKTTDGSAFIDETNKLLFDCVDMNKDGKLSVYDVTALQIYISNNNPKIN